MEYLSTIHPFEASQNILSVKAIKAFILSLIMILYAPSCLGQNGWASAQDWKNISMQHEAGKLPDTLYFLKAQALTEKSFKNPALKEKLSLYRKIAWSDAAYQPFRVKYYAFLANHATFIHQEGYAIYYLQKLEEELQKIKPYVNSLNQPRLLLYIYGNNDRTNQDRRIAIIDSVMPFLKSLPKQLSRQPVFINTCINAFTILKHASQLYLIRSDTVRVLEMLTLSRKIWKELEKKTGLDQGKMDQCRYSLYLTECAGARILSEKDREREILNTAYRSLTSKNNQISPVFKRPLERTILGRLIDYHIYQNQFDSANYYFAQFKNNEASYKKNEYVDGTKFLVYSGKVHAINEDYRAAYQDILRAYEMNDSIISIKTADIQNNMHANLVAEQRNEALIKTEKEKGNRNLVIFVILNVLIMTIFLFNQRLQASSAKANRQIEGLNKTAQIQIAELEASAKSVQKKMGMELHDDIAGRLVNISNFIETRVLDEKDPKTKSTLTTIREMTKDAYSKTRSKSHEWYYSGLKEEAVAFSQRVFQIVDQALPDREYEKQIEIDDHSLKHLSPEMRIQLLRIIQEAVANILKHAKANKIKLYLYEEVDSIVLQIADNGKGFDLTAKSKGLGLESLKNRVNEMRGSLDITPSRKGTELLFTIPFSVR